MSLAKVIGTPCSTSYDCFLKVPGSECNSSGICQCIHGYLHHHGVDLCQDIGVRPFGPVTLPDPNGASTWAGSSSTALHFGCSTDRDCPTLGSGAGPGPGPGIPGANGFRCVLGSCICKAGFRHHPLKDLCLPTLFEVPCPAGKVFDPKNDICINDGITVWMESRNYDRNRYSLYFAIFLIVLLFFLLFKGRNRSGSHIFEFPSSTDVRPTVSPSSSFFPPMDHPHIHHHGMPFGHVYEPNIRGGSYYIPPFGGDPNARQSPSLQGESQVRFSGYHFRRSPHCLTGGGRPLPLPPPPYCSNPDLNTDCVFHMGGGSNSEKPPSYTEAIEMDTIMCGRGRFNPHPEASRLMEDDEEDNGMDSRTEVVAVSSGVSGADGCSSHNCHQPVVLMVVTSSSSSPEISLSALNSSLPGSSHRKSSLCPMAAASNEASYSLNPCPDTIPSSPSDPLPGAAVSDVDAASSTGVLVVAVPMSQSLPPLTPSSPNNGIENI